MVNRSNYTLAFIALIWAIVSVPAAWGQAVSGTITGVVTDPSNAAVAGATVTITNVDTSIDTTRESDETGRYVNTNLSPGNYSVAVEAAGFQRFVQENVVLRVDQTVRVDPVLQLGAVTEQVVVSAAPPMLKSEKTDVGSYIPEDQLQALPTFGNNLSKLYNTVPGVIQNFFQIGIGENPSEFNATLVNGQDGGYQGVLVESIAPDSAAENSGLEAEDVIFRVNRTDVRNVEQMKAAAENRSLLVLHLARGNRRVVITVRG